MGVISWIVFGLIAGALARWLMPGKDSGGFVMTCLLGIAGAYVGGYIRALPGLGTVSGFDIRSSFIAVIGAIVLLTGYRYMTGKKA